MSQLSGAFTIELATDQLAERIAARVVELLRQPAGSAVYERTDPPPASGYFTDSDPGGYPLGGLPGRRRKSGDPS